MGRADHDLLSMLVFARDEETGETMTDKQIRDDVMTFFIAGHETTATALSWTWYLLSKHPAVERQLQAELTEVLGGRAPTAADMPKLRYTLMVLREAMLLVGIGLGLGIPLSLASSRLLGSFLFGLTATDPLSLAAVMLLLVAVSLLAGMIPARRAAKVDPMVALRYE